MIERHIRSSEGEALRSEILGEESQRARERELAPALERELALALAPESLLSQAQSDVRSEVRAAPHQRGRSQSQRDRAQRLQGAEGTHA